MLHKSKSTNKEHPQMQKIAVLGMGRSGLASLRLALSNHITAYVFDDNTEKVPEEFSNLYAHYSDWPWDELDAVVFSPGIPTYLPQPHPASLLSTKFKVPIISDIELVIRLEPASKWIVITGTNGKSTTTALTAHILSSSKKPVAVGGNLGTSMAELNSPGANGFRVVELSSYQLEITPSLNPNISAILNLSPDHLDRHGSMANYAAAKAEAVRNVKPDGLIILGNSSNLLPLLPSKYECRLHLISEDDTPDGIKQNFALSGSHNAENAAVAATICRHVGIQEEQIKTAILSFKGLPHRLELVASCDVAGNQLRIINDSKATNDAAAARALSSFQQIFWCAGGLAKDPSLTNCIKELRQVRHVYLYGNSKTLFQSELSGLIPTTVTENLEDATSKAFAAAKKLTLQDGIDSFVLLSPAASSFDTFANFEERGKQFTDLAKKLCQQHSYSAEAR